MVFDIRVVFERIPKVLAYLPITLQIAVTAMFFSLLVGFLVAVIKIRRIPVLYQLSTVYVSITRGTPVLIQLYATYFGLPMILRAINTQFGLNMNINGIPPIVFSLVALSLNDAAYSSEAIRAAIQAVDKGQIEAAHSIGMGTWQTLRHIVIPEAMVIALPSLGNAFIGMIKGTSLVFVTAVVEMSAYGRMLAGRDFRFFEMYVSLAIVYWVITLVISRLLHFAEKKLKCNERAVEGVPRNDKATRLEEKV